MSIGVVTSAWIDAPSRFTCPLATAQSHAARILSSSTAGSSRTAEPVSGRAQASATSR
ncbi:MAG: hypothetical protein RLZZ387_3 [Chloroflexota bacterium]